MKAFLAIQGPLGGPPKAAGDLRELRGHTPLRESLDRIIPAD
jgi:hypothetical protein